MCLGLWWSSEVYIVSTIWNGVILYVDVCVKSYSLFSVLGVAHVLKVYVGSEDLLQFLVTFYLVDEDRTFQQLDTRVHT